ncbi:MAG TPA: glycosyltransferase family 2 protein [Chromatiales bacterium]|nr:glycosyltransferase family 2 protein [Chromatiales bacterium]
MTSATHIVASIATYNRPKGLANVLDGLESQNIPENMAFRVLIVDNSEEGNAREYVENRAKHFKYPLKYIHEKKKGIAYPRNRGLADALESNDDYIALTDDDMLLEPDWISALYKTAEETEAEAVIGAIKAHFPSPPPPWLSKGNFTESADILDQQPIEYGQTGNALLRVEVIRKFRLRFDPFFALSGGEDTAFFNQLIKRGGHIVFSRNAVAYECYGPERLKLGWWMRRWYRTGNTDGFLKLQENNANVRIYFVLIVMGIFRMLIGAAGSLISLPTRMVNRFDTYEFLRIMCRGAGFLASVFGFRFEEYKNHER